MFSTFFFLMIYKNIEDKNMLWSNFTTSLRGPCMIPSRGHVTQRQGSRCGGLPALGPAGGGNEKWSYTF